MQQVKVINEVVHGAHYLRAGETVDLPASTAADLEKVGHVKVLGEAKAAPEPANKKAPEPQNKSK